MSASTSGGRRLKRAGEVDEPRGGSTRPAGPSSRSRGRGRDEDEGAINGRGEQEAVENGEHEEEEEDDDPFSTILPKAQVDAEFRNRALDQHSALSRLNASYKEWKSIVKKLEEGVSYLTRAAVDVAEALSQTHEPDEILKNEDIRGADTACRALIDRLFEAKTRRAIIEDIQHRLQLGQPVTDVCEVYEEGSRAKMAEYNAKTARARYMNDELYKQHTIDVYQACHDNAPVPNMKRLIPREAGDPESDDEDIEMHEGVEEMRDPLSKAWLEEPMRHPACKHVYSRSSIVKFIRGEKGNGTSSICPVSGCNKIVKLAELELDEGLARRVKKRQQREQEKERRQSGGYTAVVDDEDEDE